MTNTDMTTLEEELQHFCEEKEKIRRIIGEIGGTQSAKREKVITLVFGMAVLVLFLLDFLRHFLWKAIPMPPLFSLAIGVLLVSLKIMWMMHKQARLEHFQFWILNSIEFRLNDISKKVQQLEKCIKQP